MQASKLARQVPRFARDEVRAKAIPLDRYRYTLRSLTALD
jgi:hypothetical protein